MKVIKDLEENPKVVLSHRMKGIISRLRPQKTTLVLWKDFPPDIKRKLIELFNEAGWLEAIENISEFRVLLEYLATEIKYDDDIKRHVIVYEAGFKYQVGGSTNNSVGVFNAASVLGVIIHEAIAILETPYESLVIMTAPSLAIFDMPDGRKKYVIGSEVAR
jgi:hypothetical protein